jgi:hypothetical protein
MQARQRVSRARRGLLVAPATRRAIYPLLKTLRRAIVA